MSEKVEMQRVNMNLPTKLLELVENEKNEKFVSDRTQMIIIALWERYNGKR